MDYSSLLSTSMDTVRSRYVWKTKWWSKRHYKACAEVGIYRFLCRPTLWSNVCSTCVMAAQSAIFVWFSAAILNFFFAWHLKCKNTDVFDVKSDICGQQLKHKAYVYRITANELKNTPTNLGELWKETHPILALEFVHIVDGGTYSDQCAAFHISKICYFFHFSLATVLFSFKARKSNFLLTWTRSTKIPQHQAVGICLGDKIGGNKTVGLSLSKNISGTGPFWALVFTACIGTDPPIKPSIFYVL